MNNNYHHSKHYKKSTNSKKTLYISLILTLAFSLLELLGGIISNSLALIGDSFHMFSDVLALFSSIIAIYFSSKEPNNKFTFGFLRLETIVAFLNGVALILISGYILFEGFMRIIHPRSIDFKSMFLISFIGLIFNIVITAILIKGTKHEKNLNVQSALYHFIGDTLNSVGVIIASLIIYFTNFIYIDSIISIIISIVLFIGGFKITKEAFIILMEGVPTSLNSDEIKDDLMKLENIKSIHEFHIWSTNDEEISLIAHVELKDDKDNKNYIIINDITKLLKEKYAIEHISIQIENQSINIHN